MANPKYANLPGIDTDSHTDVYECGDLPEGDQQQQATWRSEELQSTSVEIVDLDTQTAFERFSDAYVTGQVNFAGGDKQRQRRIGYRTQLDDEEETVLQKYNRLKLEVAALSQEVSEIKAAKKERCEEVKLLEKVQQLDTQLSGENVDELAEHSSSVAGDLNVEKALLAIKNKSSAQESSAAATPGANGTYEVYLKSKPDQRKVERFFQLEQRLSKLEGTVGMNKEAMVNVLGNHGGATLMEAVQMMETKLALLDPEMLPLVDTRLQSILVKVNEINKAKKQAESGAPGTAGENMAVLEQNKKIEELYAMVQRWDNVSVALPDIQKRLMDLSVVQTKAGSFLTTLKHLESVQESLMATLSKTEVSQQAMAEALKGNLEIVQGNIAALSKRFDALKK